MEQYVGVNGGVSDPLHSWFMSGFQTHYYDIHMVVYVRTKALHIAGITVENRKTTGFSCDLSCITCFERK